MLVEQFLREPFGRGDVAARADGEQRQTLRREIVALTSRNRRRRGRGIGLAAIGLSASATVTEPTTGAGCAGFGATGAAWASTSGATEAVPVPPAAGSAP